MRDKYKNLKEGDWVTFGTHFRDGLVKVEWVNQRKLEGKTVQVTEVHRTETYGICFKYELFGYWFPEDWLANNEFENEED